MLPATRYMDYFDSLGVNESEAWRPWTLDGKQRMGGYVVSWPGNLHYLTIRGSGHMVPEYKPAATLAFIEAFVKGGEFPRYVPPPPTAGAGSKQRSKLFP